MKNTSVKKRTVDKEQFFTVDELVDRCVSLLEKKYGIDSFGLIVEPSAGAGAFVRKLPKDKTVAIDIEPMANGIEKADFFQWVPPKTQGRVLCIGNPPFGQRASLAVRFIKTACSFSDVVAFILPRSFNKDTFRNRVDKKFHLVDSFDCEDFKTPDEKRVTIKSVFQIWEKRQEKRSVEQRPSSHLDFEMKHVHVSRVSQEELQKIRDHFDFAIPQVGLRFAPKQPEQVTAGSYWFIKGNASCVRQVFEKLDFSFLHNQNTTFTSLSKKDIIQAYCSAKKDA